MCVLRVVQERMVSAFAPGAWGALKCRQKNRRCGHVCMNASSSRRNDAERVKNQRKKVNARYVSFEDVVKQKKLEADARRQAEEEAAESAEQARGQPGAGADKGLQVGRDVSYENFQVELERLGLDSGAINPKAQAAELLVEQSRGLQASKPSDASQNDQDQANLDAILGDAFGDSDRGGPALSLTRPPPRPAPVQDPAPAASAVPPVANGKQPSRSSRLGGGQPAQAAPSEEARLSARPPKGSMASETRPIATYKVGDEVDLAILKRLVKFRQEKCTGDALIAEMAAGSLRTVVLVGGLGASGAASMSWLNMLREFASEMYRPSLWTILGVCRAPVELKADALKALPFSIVVDESAQDEQIEPSQQPSRGGYFEAFGSCKTYILEFTQDSRAARVRAVLASGPNATRHVQQVLDAMLELRKSAEGSLSGAEPVDVGHGGTAVLSPSPPALRPEQSGRLVVNHSTHIPSLLRTLERMCQEPGVKSIVPGRVGAAKSNARGRSGLYLRVTVPTDQGWKLLARKGTQVQEVFLVVSPDMKRDDVIRLAMRYSDK
ncbi:hypothetical protein FVE85_5135 [Porphyridium purpureum]|uniref:Uncharacterized protein n=1 Tax=Porphyridium purpureum TaxID=35688 RepID=A0A5J4Z2N3_PORPP|nr:hypothetical protein FVE85_5135 [Porphyridium purpureum]|eukprot:POR0156..scf295_1